MVFETVLERGRRLARQHAHRTAAAPRWMVCAFYVNWVYTEVQLWMYGHPHRGGGRGGLDSFPWLHVLGVLPAVLLLLANMKPTVAAAILLAASSITCMEVFSQIVWAWVQFGALYINELMVKKLAIMGAMSLVLLLHYNPKRPAHQAPIAPALFLDPPSMTTRKSALMLAGRLLLSTLFVWVGVKEIQRQLNNTIERNGHVYRRRPVGDGHDAMWYKLLEFGLSLPFMLGYKTAHVARALAAVLVLEALTAWAWWTSHLSAGYRIHAREHFAVNVSVAGGLLLLCAIGAGKYTVDELLRKKTS